MSKGKSRAIMKYNAKYFREVYPEWGWKKCSFTVRHFYRPISFHCAAILANMRISANTVSYVSGIIAVVGSGLFLLNSYPAHIIGALLINLWLLMDCIDGNLARGVRKQPFGEFADAISGYLLAGLMCTTMGFAAYNEGGILFKSHMPCIILLGALASSSDSLMRLIYHKYKQIEREMFDNGAIEIENDAFDDIEQSSNIKVRIEYEFGISGILPFFILVSSIFHTLDLVVLYCFFYYFGSFLVILFIYVRKAIQKAK